MEGVRMQLYDLFMGFGVSGVQCFIDLVNDELTE